MEISGLEDELKLAEGLPRLLYVKGPAPDREPELAGLLARIASEAADSYRHFRSAAELGRLVRDDLATLLSERFAAEQPAPRAAPAAASGPRQPAARSRSARRRWSAGSRTSARWPSWPGGPACGW